jgi:predicted ATP-dependent endonuclease of OLD family
MNETGKSNILNAISLLDSDKLDSVIYDYDCNKNAEEE